MSDLPTLDGAAEALDRTVKQLVPWLPEPHTCDCGAYCDAVVTYDPHMVEYTDAWRCPECGNEYYREGY